VNFHPDGARRRRSARADGRHRPPANIGAPGHVQTVMIAQVRSLPAQVRPFRLTRWFAVLSLASIVIFGVATATLLSRLMGERMLYRTGEVNMEFVTAWCGFHDGVRFFPQPGRG
jgi:hypothetical protein